MNKKLVATLSAAALIGGLIYTNPAEASIGDKYQLNNTVKVYMDSMAAKAGLYAVKNYVPGLYYIFNEYIGMINITKDPSSPGAWFNPADNKPVSPIGQIVDSKVILKSSITKYYTSLDAKQNINPVGTYPAGTYYIYKTANGMTNITRTPGMPGAWVNLSGITAPPSTTPKTTAPVTTTPKTTSPVTGDYILKYAVPTYMDSEDAMNRVNSLGNYPAGTYWIYKTANGMINITTIKGQPGRWINPNPVTPPSTTTPSTTAPVTTTPSTTAPVTTTPSTTAPVGNYTLTAPAKAYLTASDAAKWTNSTGTYPAGKYFIYKTDNGMINITRTPGVPGAWINPNPVTPPSTTTPSTTAPVTTTPSTTAPTPNKANHVYVKTENGMDFYDGPKNEFGPMKTLQDIGNAVDKYIRNWGYFGYAVVQWPNGDYVVTYKAITTPPSTTTPNTTAPVTTTPETTTPVTQKVLVKTVAVKTFTGPTAGDDATNFYNTEFSIDPSSYGPYQFGTHTVDGELMPGPNGSWTVNALIYELK